MEEEQRQYAKCTNCGYEIKRIHCIYLCPNCGFQTDCSDM